MKKLDHDAERNKIAAVAAQVIAEQGAAKVTLQLVADKLGSTRGRVLHYFPSKQKVIEAAFEWANQQMLDRIPELLSHAEADNFIEYVVHSNLPLQADTDVEWRVRQAYWEVALNSDDGCKKRQETEALRIDFIEGILIKQQELGLVNPNVDTRMTAIQLYDMVTGLTTALLFIPLKERPSRLKGLNAFLNSLYH